MNKLLADLLDEVGASSGTIHQPRDGHLILTASIGLPDSIKPAIAKIPKGKGMAGMAWETGRSVTTCSLRTDPNTTIQTGARAVEADAAIAVPVIDRLDEIIGVVGFAFEPGTDAVETRMDRCLRAVKQALSEFN
ncbi:MAG: GAF domain-containing protein [Myxococcota bacterium]|nr:GAF domain-containing protein [Myxococcota bacterium]